MSEEWTDIATQADADAFLERCEQLHDFFIRSWEWRAYEGALVDYVDADDCFTRDTLVMRCCYDSEVEPGEDWVGALEVEFGGLWRLDFHPENLLPLFEVNLLVEDGLFVLGHEDSFPDGAFGALNGGTRSLLVVAKSMRWREVPQEGLFPRG